MSSGACLHVLQVKQGRARLSCDPVGSCQVWGSSARAQGPCKQVCEVPAGLGGFSTQPAWMCSSSGAFAWEPALRGEQQLARARSWCLSAAPEPAVLRLACKPCLVGSGAQGPCKRVCEVPAGLQAFSTQPAWLCSSSRAFAWGPALRGEQQLALARSWCLIVCSGTSLCCCLLLRWPATALQGFQQRT